MIQIKFNMIKNKTINIKWSESNNVMFVIKVEMVMIHIKFNIVNNKDMLKTYEHQSVLGQIVIVSCMSSK